MSILDMFEKSPEKEFEDAEARNARAMEEALKMHDKDKNALKMIKDSEGFKKIVLFWENEKSACENYFRKGVKLEYLNTVQGKYEISCRFLGYLKAMLDD